MKLHPLIVSFVGWSGSGKTNLVVATIAELKRRGRSCAAVKCTRHGGDFEPPGKDSARFRAAGAASTAFIGSGEGGLTVLYSPTPDLRDRAWLESLFPDASLILSEGLVVEDAIKVLIIAHGDARVSGQDRDSAPAESQETKHPLDWANIVVSADPAFSARARKQGVRVADPDDIASFVNLLEAAMDREVSITAGGKLVPLNDFAKDIVGNTILGLVGSLKQAATDEEIIITIGKKK